MYIRNYCLVCICTYAQFVYGMYIIFLIFIMKYVISMYRAVDAMYSICQSYVRMTSVKYT